MKRLIVLRHCKSDWPGGLADEERPLAPRGIRAAAAIGTLLAERRLIADQVLCSTAERTRETWALVSAAWPAKPPVAYRRDLYQGGTPAILAALAESGKAAGSQMVIGHNPDLQQLVLGLARPGEARDRVARKFPSGGLAVLDIPVEDWRAVPALRQGADLVLFVTPRMLEG